MDFLRGVDSGSTGHGTIVWQTVHRKDKRKTPAARNSQLANPDLTRQTDFQPGNSPRNERFADYVVDPTRAAGGSVKSPGS